MAKKTPDIAVEELKSEADKAEADAGQPPVDSSTEAGQPPVDDVGATPTKEESPEAGTQPAEEGAEVATSKARRGLLEVTNVSKGELRQHSTGLTIQAGETKGLLEDGWLENQLNAGLLLVVE